MTVYDKIIQEMTLTELAMIFSTCQRCNANFEKCDEYKRNGQTQGCYFCWVDHLKQKI